MSDKTQYYLVGVISGALFVCSVWIMSSAFEKSAGIDNEIAEIKNTSVRYHEVQVHLADASPAWFSVGVRGHLSEQREIMMRNIIREVAANNVTTDRILLTIYMEQALRDAGIVVTTVSFLPKYDIECDGSGCKYVPKEVKQ